MNQSIFVALILISCLQLLLLLTQYSHLSLFSMHSHMPLIALTLVPQVSAILLLCIWRETHLLKRSFHQSQHLPIPTAPK